MEIPAIKDYLTDKNIKCKVDEDVIIFMIENINDDENWRVIGQTSTLSYTEGKNLLSIRFNIAKNAKSHLYDKICPKLMELNRLSVFGYVYMNELDDIKYSVNIPLIDEDEQHCLDAFSSAFEQMYNFIQAYYAYILVIINDPDKLELNRYIELMTME